MDLKQIHVSAIIVARRLRAADPDWVAAIAESFRDRGQRTPIEVRVDEHGQYRLVAGLHRLEAARSLGWDTIEASLFQGTDLEARLDEIDENLLRRELSELDRSIFLAERKTLWQELHPHTSRAGRKNRGKLAHISEGPLEERFSAATAKKLGLSASIVDRALRRAAIADDVRDLLTSHPVARKGAQLDQLAALTPADQRRVAAALLDAADPARNVTEAAQRIGLLPRAAPADADEQSAQSLARVWHLASDKARARFLAAIGAELVAA
jgi:ParB family transcriptional regulator, chromosome partitioning protein